MEFQSLGRWIIGFGIVFVLIGLVLVISPKIPWLGRLPGDIYIKRENVSFYFPVVTCLILSLVMTVIVNLFKK